MSHGTSSTGASPTNQNTYTYNANIPDELSSVTMKVGSTTTTRNYTYDAIGNPTQITETTGDSAVTKTLTWKQGKQLHSVAFSTDGTAGKTYTYTYDESGRVKKKSCSDGSYTKYHYDSNNLEYEERFNASGTQTYVIKYFYDDQDRVQFALLKNRNFTISTGYYNLYTYVYNGYGEITDIVKLRTGVTVANTTLFGKHVAHYEYDPYGNIISATNYNDDIFGTINPIRYKGYYYDTDLEWYNLQTRFYDPSVGRFINCDDISLLTETPSQISDKNLYAYCDNNPVMRKDTNGELWHIAAGAAIGACVSAAIEMVSQVAMDGKITDSGAIFRSAVTGAVSGAFASTGIGLSGQAGINALIGIADNALNKNADKSLTGFLKAGLIGGISGVIGGKGAKLDELSDAWDVTVKKINRETKRRYRPYAEKATKRYRNEQRSIRRSSLTSLSRFVSSSIFSRYCPR